ncbi:MAG: N-acetylmuramoyl-L-alanine amidase [Pseudomonadota bacterium]
MITASVTEKHCIATDKISPFDEADHNFPRHSDREQNTLMTPLNLVELEKSPSKKLENIKRTADPDKSMAKYRLKIMIDPGHGGKDDGAAGRHGIREKNISLNLAKKVKREVERLAKTQGYPVELQLTREEDVFVPLKERARMANAWGADLFVSVHLNSSPVSKARGFEVYFLSPEASDPETEHLALKESEGQLPSSKDDVLSILSDVRTTFHMNESAQFAEEMFSSISRSVLSNGRGVRQGPFTVLHGTNMPALLVEVGYVTHPEESRLLTKEPYLKRLASAISSGIIEFGLRTRKLG